MMREYRSFIFIHFGTCLFYVLRHRRWPAAEHTKPIHLKRHINLIRLGLPGTRWTILQQFKVDLISLTHQQNEFLGKVFISAMPPRYNARGIPQRPLPEPNCLVYLYEFEQDLPVIDREPTSQSHLL